MLVKQVEVKLKTGLQARPAALFVQEANRFSADVFLEKDGKKVNAKSIMGLMSLAVGSGSIIKLLLTAMMKISIKELQNLLKE